MRSNNISLLQVCIHSNGTVNFHFSADDLVSCCHTCGFGCNGGFPGAAWSYWTRKGIVSGGSYNSSQVQFCMHISKYSHILLYNKGLSTLWNPTMWTPCRWSSSTMWRRTWINPSLSTSMHRELQKRLQFRQTFWKKIIFNHSQFQRNPKWNSNKWTCWRSVYSLWRFYIIQIW